MWENDFKPQLFLYFWEGVKSYSGAKETVGWIKGSRTINMNCVWLQLYTFPIWASKLTFPIILKKKRGVDPSAARPAMLWEKEVQKQRQFSMPMLLLRINKNIMRNFIIFLTAVRSSRQPTPNFLSQNITILHFHYPFNFLPLFATRPRTYPPPLNKRLTTKAQRQSK